jgi:hypothetical protein
MPDQPFHQNVTLITGASTGIGCELAYQLCEFYLRGTKSRSPSSFLHGLQYATTHLS